MSGYTLTEKLYVNSDKSAVVDESSPEAAYLLGIEGTVIDEEEARKLGLYSGESEADPVKEEKMQTPAENKEETPASVGAENKSEEPPRRARHT